jgi:glyoxylase-like metal-dependent hydrolase (beta-lactamase superfamily II)
VHQQPNTTAEIAQTRAALAACPVAAIRLETRAERQHAAAIRTQQHSAVLWSTQDEWIVQHMTCKDQGRPFPRPFLQNETSLTDKSVPHVYWTGHHNEASFGAIPYLFQAQHQGQLVWIMVDTPKFHTQSVKDITSLTGPNGPQYLLLTHVDDTADHGKWAAHFPECRRIFHSGDLGRHNWLGDLTLEQVPILLPSPSSSDESKLDKNVLTAYTLDGDILDHDWPHRFTSGQLNSDVVVLHAPGHSPGSICLWKRRTNDGAPGILFTGDTYAYNGAKMTGFGRHGNNAQQQVYTLSLLRQLEEWDIVAPGHGLSRDYRDVSRAVRDSELQQAQNDLLAPRYARRS